MVTNRKSVRSEMLLLVALVILTGVGRQRFWRYCFFAKKLRAPFPFKLQVGDEHEPNSGQPDRYQYEKDRHHTNSTPHREIVAQKRWQSSRRGGRGAEASRSYRAFQQPPDEYSGRLAEITFTRVPL